MSFYTPTWVRRLVKEDHKNVQEFVTKKGNDFRDYIDANTPFVLWLDIGLIRERILQKQGALISELAIAVSVERDVSDIVLNLLDKAYINTINKYATNPRYIQINSEELENRLSQLSSAPLGSVKQTLDKLFNRTMVVTNTTKKNKSVMLILPKFTTLAFGPVFREELAKLVKSTKSLKDSKPVPAVGGMFGGLVSKNATEDDSEKSRMLAFVESNFSRLQNIGHVEVDVISEVDRKVMRGQNSPRLLQALISLPNVTEASMQRLQLKFSKETGQAETRVKVRKKFAGSKMVFELLVEHGLAVGIPETQQDNLYKAQLERAFSVGRGFTETIRTNPNVLIDLETSKSLKQYIEGLVVNSLLGKPTAPYSSDTEIKTTSKITKTKVTSNLKSKKPTEAQLAISKYTLSRSKLQQLNLVSLQNLINANLADQIKKNMGDGNRRDVLNLRTGRLAESATVERVSQSRAGMITAFYSYMKNPYATFSEGGRQQYPRTRDPKLLISKSIREIAQQQVANRLRAVLI